MVWLALIVPVIACVYLLLFHRQATIWWEYLVVFLVPLLIVPTTIGIVRHFQAQDVEYWGGWVTEAHSYEEWDEKVSCSHETGYTDSEGNWHHTGYQHSYDVNNHPPYWVVFGSNGEEHRVSQTEYDRLAKQFGNDQFVDLNRDYHSIDGDMYKTIFPMKWELCEPLITKHTYENKTQVSDSIYEFEPVESETVEQYGLFEYPEIVGWYSCPTVLSQDPSFIGTADKTWSVLCAKLGRSEEVRFWVLIFVDQPQQAAVEQMNYWKGGNKNELIMCIGVDKNQNIQWSDVFSWSEYKTIEVETEDFINGQEKLDLQSLATWIEPEVREKWVRKEFVEFSYLEVKLPFWAILLTWLLTIAASVGIVYYVVYNDIDDDNIIEKTLLRMTRRK